MFEGLSWLRLDGETVIDVLLKLLSRGVLIEESIDNFLNVLEKPRWEGVELI